MKNLRPLFLVLLIAAVCGGGGYYFYQQQQRQTRTQKAGNAAEELAAGSNRPDGPSHTLARTRFRILQSSAPDVFGTTAPNAKAEMSATWMQAQIKTLSSPKVLAPVVQRLNLETEWGLPAEKAIARLQEMMAVELSGGTDVVSVTVRGYSPNTCADVANAVRDAYEQVRKEMEAERLQRLTQTVDAQIEAQLKTVEARKAELDALQKKHGIAEAAPRNETSSPAPPAEYATERPRYDSQVLLLNTMRELAARQKNDGIVSRPIETLEAARPGLPRAP